MARPEEKAQAMLNKWVKMRDDHNKEGLDLSRRPYLASLCEHLHDAEKYRRDILREISKGISDIQNPGLGEHGIRDLNDRINKLIREKYHWNKRILELGGPNHNQIERRQQLEESNNDPNGNNNSLSLQGGITGGGYRYFGEAKNLPGVKQLFMRHAAKITKRKRGDIYQYITPDYYGLRDEEDGVLLELEAKYYNNNNNNNTEKEDPKEQPNIIMAAGDAIAAHVAIPTQEIVAQVVLERKKRELLNKLTF